MSMKHQRSLSGHNFAKIFFLQAYLIIIISNGVCKVKTYLRSSALFDDGNLDFFQ